MPCTKCGSQHHSRENCRWPGVLLVVFSILFLIVGPAVALEATMTEEERAICEKNGGCMLVTKHALATALTRLSERLDVLELARMVGHRDLKSLMVYYRKTAAQLAYKFG